MPAVRVVTTAPASTWWPISFAAASTAGKAALAPTATSTARTERIRVSMAPPASMTQIPKPDSRAAAPADGKALSAISVNTDISSFLFFFNAILPSLGGGHVCLDSIHFAESPLCVSSADSVIVSLMDCLGIDFCLLLSLQRSICLAMLIRAATAPPA